MNIQTMNNNSSTLVQTRVDRYHMYYPLATQFHTHYGMTIADFIQWCESWDRTTHDVKTGAHRKKIDLRKTVITHG